MPDIVERLRSHQSLDSRVLLDEAAGEIEMLCNDLDHCRCVIDAIKKQNEDLRNIVVNSVRARDAAIDRAKKLEARLEAECYGDR